MLPDNQLFDLCFKLAYESHAEQVDKSGQSYLLHCMRVVEILREDFNVTDLRHLALGLVHDVLEDNKSIDAVDVLALTGDQEFVNDLILLTRTKDENYFNYIRRVNKSDRARAVKIADIDDHIDNKEYINDSLLDRYCKAKLILHGVTD